jgi:pimeloyl-ACP methyl ester carboxylesterase
MLLLARRLQRALPTTKVHLFDYFSRGGGLLELATQLGDFAHSSCNGEPVSFVGHSLGGIVARVLDQQNDRDLRLHRLVTLGSPHSGATIARVLNRYRICRAAFGPVLGELAELALPDETRQLEIGCIVGCTGRRWGFFPVFGEDNDGIVLRREAELLTSKDSVYRPILHGLLPFSAQVAELSSHFLSLGRFERVEASSHRSIV